MKCLVNYDFWIVFFFFGNKKTTFMISVVKEWVWKPIVSMQSRFDTSSSCLTTQKFRSFQVKCGREQKKYFGWIFFVLWAKNVKLFTPGPNKPLSKWLVTLSLPCLFQVGWSEARYNHVVGKLKHFLKQAGFKVCYLPCLQVLQN